ncbi:uncharacterized protein LOC123543157 isoform X2 [Mercenaria mercenaria]|uniref:uncharacterized protein LOC123543157 isoform X2 n=1 Tax=Mercenaria mercenaria TaxID=6596 RepID=UPI00234E6061|nr:uncharacterized protein LOC123543157 isoform X2 [Mercenaria mercenaria]
MKTSVGIIATKSVLLLLHLYLIGTNALRCYECQDVIQIRDCRRIVECDLGQKCFYSKKKTIELSCMREVQCRALEKILALEGHNQNQIGCCSHSDLCNGIDNSSQTAHVPTTTHSWTTTPLPRIVINAPDKAAYKSMVQLSCVTIPPAERYSWTFNGTSTLPAGVSAVQYTPNQGAVAGTDVLTIVKIDATSFGTYTCAGSIHGQTVQFSHFISIMPGTIPAVLTG